MPNDDSLSITCGHKRYLLPAEDVTVLPLVNTTLEALAGYLLSQVLPQLQRSGLVAAELEVSELPGTSATRPMPTSDELLITSRHTGLLNIVDFVHWTVH